MQQSRNNLNASYVRLPVLPLLFSAKQGLHNQLSLLQITLAVLRQKPSEVHGNSTPWEHLRGFACCVQGPNPLILQGLGLLSASQGCKNTFMDIQPSMYQCKAIF